MVCQTVKGVRGRIDSKYSEMYSPAVLAGCCDFDKGYLLKTVPVARETF